MAVSEYKNTECKYHIGKLEKVVYLIAEDDVKDIHIDDGEAYIDGISATPLTLIVYDIEITDKDELDERYKFTHTLKFSMQGYVNYLDFQRKYYAIIKTVEGVYWLVNPMFPCKVSYTYTLDSNGSHTDFTLATISNHPTLRVHDMDEATPYECNYRHCRIGELLLNETRYSLKKDANEVLYTNDGFKYIEYLRNSAVFTEYFNGDTVQHTITFKIRFDDYKSSWHYNLLEFVMNKYAAVIGMNNATIVADYDYDGDGVVDSGWTEDESGSTHSSSNIGVGLDCDCSVLVGFNFGLQPSFTVNATDDSEIDYIEIKLSDIHDTGTFVSCGEVEIKHDDAFAFVDEVKECVDKNLAKYLLKKEVDSFGNSTGRYLALEGYETRFENLNIVGTFDESEIVNCSDPNCVGEECLVYTSLPNPLVLTDSGCTRYPFRCDSDWSFTSSNENITITPSSGSGHTDYTIEVCNSQEPSDEAENSTLTLDYCNTTKTFDVSLTSCFTAGRIFRITADEQYVNVPHKCCILSVVDNSGIAIDINIQDRYFRVFMPENESGEERTIPLDVEFCDGSHGEVEIIQEFAYVRWVKEGEKCVDRDRCDIERKYTGLTSDNINTWTDTTRVVNCRLSVECGILTRWIDGDETMCENGILYTVEKEQSSIDYGETWEDTGMKRKGHPIPDVEEICAIATCEEWRPDGYICDEFTKYERERQWVRDCEDCNNCGSVWRPTSNFRKSDVIIEENSRECGYDPCADWCLSASCTEWRVVGDVCEDCDKYEYLRQYFRLCADCNDCSAPWTATNVYKKGNLIQSGSTDCCVTPVEYEYRWVLTDMTVCVGYDKYRVYKYQYRISGSTDAWQDFVPTRTSYNGNGTMTPVLVEANSEDCGYNPPTPTPQYKWETVGWVCGECESSGTPVSSRTKLRYRINGGSNVDVDCSSSTEITSSDYNNNSGITYAFIGTCVTSIGGGAFTNRYYLESVEMPNTIISIGTYAFHNCISLIDFTLPDSITSIGNHAFEGCIQLNKINLPSELLTLGTDAFKDCKNFSTINIPSKLTSIPLYCFYGCKGMTDIRIPSGITSIGERAFYGCSALVNVWVYSTTPPTLGNYAFYNTSTEIIKNLNIYVPSSAVNTYKNASGWSNYADKIKSM